MKWKEVCFTGAWLLFCAVNHAPGQGTAMTYQGRLADNGNPANGTYDLRFTLYDAATSGNVAGGPLTNPAVFITNGLFAAPLNFASNAFPGSDRWLEIAARTNGATTFIVLSPRQKITAVPYAVTAGSLSGPLAEASLSGAYGGAVTLSNPSNGFAGSGAGLTNVPAAGIAGLRPMAFQDTNGPVFNTGINYGFFTIFTNSAFPYGGLNLDAGGNANMFWNQMHPGGGEFQIVSTGSMAFGAGIGDGLGSHIQIGSSAPTFQGYAELINFQYDSLPDAAHLLGYSHLVQWMNQYWNGTVPTFSSPAGVRSEALDTNGNSALMFYNPTTDNNVLWGQSPGRLQLGVLPDGALLNGKLMRQLTTPVVFTNYGVDFTQGQFAELTLTTNLSLYITNLVATNFTLEKDLYLRPGSNSWAVAFPGDWLWEGDGVSNTAPTNVLAETVLHVHLTANCSGLTNIYARATYAPYMPINDTNMLQFVTAAGITDPAARIALNQFVQSAKAHGYWTNLIAVYPFVGGTSNSCSWNLIDTNRYRIAWHGAMGFNATGITGDGTTAYGTTGIDPSLALPGAQNSTFAAVWVRGPTTPNDNGYFYSCVGNNNSQFGMFTTLPEVSIDGMNNNAQGEVTYYTGRKFAGLAGQCRLAGTIEQDYVVSTPYGGSITRSPTTALPAGQPVTLLAQYQNTPTNFSNANLSWAFIGSGLTTGQINSLIFDASICNSILNR